MLVWGVYFSSGVGEGINISYVNIMDSVFIPCICMESISVVGFVVLVFSDPVILVSL